MRRDVRLLGDILGEVIRDSEGPELLADVERLRRAVIEARRGEREECLADGATSADPVGDEIAALVADTPTAQYISSSEIKNSVLVGQFPSSGEHFGLLFRKGDPLVGCVDKALATLHSNGTLAALQKKYLQVYLSVPLLKP